ncbi:uncharacterized protein [Mycetomoellerius zeteki]|uniref:uncharacterized protein n=1 Tax=Mycetomoellerius zeteki TaxID=64791 RepID=UPI00084E7409|nr:PREDICTED: uncharacterized protein LOC108728179 [Trachymyrmex zeteki]
MGQATVEVGPRLKYLGLTLDGAWEFGGPFDQLAPRLHRQADALAGIMPNLGGPRGAVRKMYPHAVLSGLLYGAPVWAGKAVRSRHIKRAMYGMQRRLCIRIARAYRTVSHTSATVLATRRPPSLGAGGGLPNGGRLPPRGYTCHRANGGCREVGRQNPGHRQVIAPTAREPGDGDQDGHRGHRASPAGVDRQKVG